LVKAADLLAWADPSDLEGLREEAFASTDRPDYVIEHLGELLLASETHRPKAWNSEGRGD
jgi:hypothetical protein